MNTLNVLLGVYLGMTVIGAGMLIWRALSDWWLGVRVRRAEAAEKAALFDLLVLEEQLDHQALEQEDRQIAERMNEVWPDWHVEVARPQFYPPIGPLPRPPLLPSIYEAYGVPNLPTYPGDLPPAADIRPQWQRECEEIVRASGWDA